MRGRTAILFLALLLIAGCGSGTVYSGVTAGTVGLEDSVGGTNGSGNGTDGTQGGIDGSEDRTDGSQHGGGDSQISGTEVPKKDLTVGDAYQVILNGCTRDFIGGYLLDEAFLSWLTAQCGESVILNLAQTVEAGELDPELWYELTGSSIHVLWSMYSRDTGFQDYSLDRVYWKECASSEEIVIDFIGDINFAENWSTTRHLDQQVDGLYDCFSNALMEELNQADILMVNNEFTYSNRGTPLEGKAYTFRADPDRVYYLEIMGADIVSLANNHSYDYGPDALLDTLDTLAEAEVPYVGAGRNLAEAMEPSYFIANGRKIAFVSATQIERSTNYTKEATEDSPGVLKTLNPDKFLTVIETAEQNADYVIVYVHWGTEQNPNFEEDQTQLAQAYIEAGADAIIGGHTHCLQGCQYLDGVPVFYSLGNFWFNSNKLDTGIAQLILDQDGTMKFRFLPCVQKKNETYLVEDQEERIRILDYLESISRGVTIGEDGLIKAIQ